MSNTKPSKSMSTTVNIAKVENLANDGSTINVKNVTKKAQERTKLVGIFWDIQNCCVPKGKSVVHLVDKIRKHFIPEDQKFELKTFACVCDINRESRGTVKDLQSGTVNVVHVDADAKNAADEKIKSLMDEFAKDAPTGSKVILISSDVNFSEKLSHLKNKCNFLVVLIHKRNVNESLLLQADETVIWEEFTQDLRDITGYIDSAEDLLIVDGYNISSGNDIKVIQEEINTLILPYGGRVVDIAKLFAIVKLGDKNCIHRVKDELNGKDMSGWIIKVTLVKDSQHRQTVESRINSHKQVDSSTKQDNVKLKKQRSGHTYNDIVTDSVPVENASTKLEVFQNVASTKSFKTGIFWDFETCQVEARHIKTVMQAIFQKYITKESRLIERICVCDVKHQEDDLLMKMAESHLKIVHSIKSSGDTLRDSLQDFSYLCSAGDKVIIISSQPQDLSLFSIKNNLQMDVVLIHSSSTPECFDFICTQHLSLSSLLHAAE